MPGSGRKKRRDSGARRARGPARSGGEGQRRSPSRKSAGGEQPPRRADGKGSRNTAARRDLKGPARNLPRWVVEALTRVTPAERVTSALDALGQAAEAFEEGRFHPAVRQARRAKELAPRDATVREILGLASYRVGAWDDALRELRTYRRLTGESTHLPVEMDVLRALGRDGDVEEAWRRLEGADAHPAVYKEGKVVYASYLLDQGRVAEARRVATPRGLSNNPHPADFRVWYVAARAAALDGDVTEAVRFRDAILLLDPSFPGLDELDAEISANT